MRSLQFLLEIKINIENASYKGVFTKLYTCFLQELTKFKGTDGPPDEHFTVMYTIDFDVFPQRFKSNTNVTIISLYIPYR